MQAWVQWIGEAKFLGTTESGQEVTMDGDRGVAPSPMEMVLMAAGSCSSVDVVSILKKSRQDVSHCEVQLTAERAETAPRVFTKIHMHFVVTGNGVLEKRVERAVQLSAEKYCSVSLMLGHAVEMSHSFEVREQAREG
jgi:putative redox protein